MCKSPFNHSHLGGFENKPYKRKKDGTANRFGSAVPSSFWLIISVPLGDTLGAFDASLDVREDQHHVVQFVG